MLLKEQRRLDVSFSYGENLEQINPVELIWTREMLIGYPEACTLTCRHLAFDNMALTLVSFSRSNANFI
jgi:hypothetical protein